MGSSVFILLIIFVSNIYLISSKPLLLPLSHSLSNSQYNSTHHLLKSTSTHSAARFHHHQNRHRRHVSLPLSPGTDYTLSFSLSSQTISLYMDTGSDVIWLPCFPFSCILCDGKSPPNISDLKPLNISGSTPVTCKSRACSAVHSHLPSSDICAIAKCPLEEIEISDCGSFNCPAFYYAYGDGSLVAKLYNDDLIIPMSSPPLKLYNFTFGCAHASLGEPIGVAGFGRGVLSLPAQLATSNPHLGNQFSYCLVSHSFDSTRVRRPSPLILGRYSFDEKNERVGKNQNPNQEEVDFIYTPLLNNPKHPYYYLVGLEAVTIGKRRLPAPASLKTVDKKGNGGMVVDSGTTYTMLPDKMYNSVTTEFSRRVETFYKRASDVEGRTGLGPCYYINSLGNVPQLVFHFVGNSSVVMPKRNYFYEYLDGGDDGKMKKKVGCMMLMNGGDFPESDGPVGLLGNYQQQGLEVMYDLENGRVGFAKRKCSALWETLTRN